MKEEIINSKYNLDFFEKLIRNRMNKLGFTGIKKYEDRVKEEYDVIVGADLENYFLIIWDILHWNKENNLLTGLSRGSAAGSFIMYLMDIVKINPFSYNLLFSRFLNAGRIASVYLNFKFEDKYEEKHKEYTNISRLDIPKGENRISAKFVKGDYINGHKIKDIEKIFKGHISLPDVDMDLSDREKTKKFIIKKYGEEQFSTLGSYNTFKIKAAIKDLCRVIGTNLDYAGINIMTSKLFFKEGSDAYFEEIFKNALQNEMFYDFVQNNPNIIKCMYWMLDTPKSSSVHPCGVLSIPDTESIYDDFPLLYQEGDSPMCVWTGPELDSLGFVKNDFLGLNQLIFFENILRLVKEKENKDIDLYHLPLNDKKVFEYLSNGWNSEVFQFNSYLLINYCKILKPTKIEDLSVAVAAVRPGPMNNGLHLKYVKRKNGEEKVDYHFGYEKYTKDTYGIILYQEQVIQIASYLGNLSLVEGDGLRKCFTGENYIWTPEGYKTFYQLVDKEHFSEKNSFNTVSLNIDAKEKSNQKISSIFAQPINKKCFRVFTKSGYIECTEDHKVYTNYGWVEVKDLTSKYFLLREKKIKFGKLEYDFNRLYLIAALISEGYIIKDLCQFINKDEQELNRYKKAFYNVFPNKKLKSYTYKGVTQLDSYCIQDELGIKRTLSDKREIPEFIFSLNKNCLSYFIGLLFDFDGCITKSRNKNSISYTSKSIKLINQISLLLSQFGIECTIVEDLLERCKGIYSISVKGSRNVILFYNNFRKYCKKLSKININFYINSEKDVSIIPNNIWQPIIENLINNSGYSRAALLDTPLKNSIHWGFDIEKDTLRKILKLYGRSKDLEFYLDNDFYWSKFWKIEEIGIHKVYDFTMNSSSSPQAFINGVLCHNCLGKKKKKEILTYHDKIKPHALEKGCSDREFEEIWSEWIEFAKYSFNKSHAVAYAITGYISQWLKIHYPREFWTSAFQKANNSSDRKEKFNQYFKELKDSNSSIKIVNPDINTSTDNTEFDGDNIYLPLNNIKYLSNDGVKNILNIRNKYGKFYSFEEFLSRLGDDKLLNKREFENLILSGVFDEIENIDNVLDRKKLIKQLYLYFRKDYYREFLNNEFKENELWWKLKEIELIGIDSIDFNAICNRYFQRYRFFSTCKIEDGLIANFGGIIIDYTERKSKKKDEYFGCITIECQNIPYDVIFWPKEWELYKDKIIKYKNQIICFEAEFVTNKSNGQLQIIPFKSSEGVIPPIFIGLDESKTKEYKSFSIKKGDFVKLEDNRIGKIIKNTSNSQIQVEFKDKTVETHTKWDFIDIVNNEY